MQADSSESREFSHKLYEQLRFDDVWNKKRLTWYIKASQKLANRSVIEKVWILVHATQIFGILWTNMWACSARRVFAAFVSRIFAAFVSRIFAAFVSRIFVRRCQGEVRWPSDFCSQGLRRKALLRIRPLTIVAAHSSRHHCCCAFAPSPLRSVFPPLCNPRRTFDGFVDSFQLE